MLTCEICGEDMPSEAEMRSHLLLSHLEAQVRCPLCSLAGVSYDELQLHINTAHAEGGTLYLRKCASTETVQNGAGPELKCSLVISHKDARGVSSCNGALNMDSSNRVACAAFLDDTANGECSVMVAGVGMSDGSSNEGSSSGMACASVLHDTADGESSVMMAGSSDVSYNEGSSDSVASREISDKAAEWRPDVYPSYRPVPRAVCLSHQNKIRLNRHACTPQGESLCTRDSGVDQEPIKTKHKRLSSPRREELLPCPMCSLVFSDSFILQEHVELHLQEEDVFNGTTVHTKGDGAQGYQCPLCSLTFPDSSSLQTHVELHLEAGTESPRSDLQLARRLQWEEDERRKAEEAKREAEDFKKLQKQFGLDGSGGYRRQIEKNMEKAVSRGHMVPAEFHRKRAEVMESLASGVDDGKTRTAGLIAALYQFYERDRSDTAHVWLSSETDHYSSSGGDRGWGCGYRNFQMLLSSLHKIEDYKGCFTDGTLPSIPRVQSLLEEAWRQGVDPQGASHFNHKLQGSSAWIGATEIYSLFTSLGVRAHIVDFHQPTGSGGTHPRLFEWVKRYFSTSASRGARLPPKVMQTSQPPIYLQHQGHSRSIVGVEQRKNGSLCLLIFDPGCPPGDMRRLLACDITAASLRHLRKHPGGLKHRQYQIVALEGVLSPEDKQTQIVNSRNLRAERVP